MAFQFPWTNFHELNLDWFLSKFKQFTNNFLETTATAESVPYNAQPSVTVTGGELDDDTDIVDPFTFNFKIPAGQPGQPGEQGEQGVPGQDGFSPIATVTKSGTVATITITDVNGTTSTTISDGEVTQAQLDTKAPAIFPTVSGSIAHFSDGADDLPMSELIVGITPSQSGSGDPAPDNIRPISGWTGCNVVCAGKNLLPNNFYGGVPYNASAGTIVNPTLLSDVVQTGNTYTKAVNSWGSISMISSPLPLGTYKLSIAVTATSTRSSLYVLDGNYKITRRIANSSVPTQWTYPITLSPGEKYIAVYLGSNSAGTVTITAPQIESGTTITAYEEYVAPATITVDWTTEAGTVYGGTLDVKTGVLTVNRAKVQLDGVHYTLGGRSAYTNVARYWVNQTIPVKYRGADSYVIADKLKTSYSDVISINNSTPSGFYTWVYTNDTVYVVLPVGTASTNAEATQWLADNPVEICYELATPQTYQLTPQQLFNTLYGVNNVWSDTGDSTVTYTADTKLYIEQLTQPTEDDMIANTSIANGKFFMIGNNLYRATTAIASGSQIIPGTNATALSLADALNLL